VTGPIDPLDPVEYLAGRILPWQVQAGCTVILVLFVVMIYFLAD